MLFFRFPVMVLFLIFSLIQKCLLRFNLVFTRAPQNAGDKAGLFFFSKRTVFDYVRIAALKMAAEEIRVQGITGNVAELGVYEGDFAVKMNAFFPDRKIYLFDTFKGFANRESLYGDNMGSRDPHSKFRLRSLINRMVYGNYEETSASSVLKRMKYPHRCIVKEGTFPETAASCDDRFAFVSIDVDLYAPVFAGLEYFYPRMSPGGYIFVHDFQSRIFTGSQKAVRDFCAQYSVMFFPLPDSTGTAVICKHPERA